jgi:hypothetical protein
MLKGSCLCGGVTVQVEGELEQQPEACHCTQCRKQSGSFLTAVNVRKSRLTIGGEEQVGWYASSDKVDRGFCKTCGSTLFWAPKMEDYEWIAVAMGLFDEPTGTRLAKHTFVADKGDYYDIDDGVPSSEGF